MVRGKVLTQGNKNYFVLILLIIMILGVGWGWLVGVKAGDVYGKIAVLTILIISLLLLWIDETDKQTMKEYFMTPITSSTLSSMGMFVFGWFIIMIFNVFGFISDKIFAVSFTSTEFYGSLYFSGRGITQGLSQSFQAGVIESSKLSEYFYSSIVAPIQEEFTWGFALYLAFYTMSIGITKGFMKNKAPFGLKNQTFHTIFAMVGVLATFMYVHNLNKSYVGIMFIIAGIFRLLVNVSMYVYGMTLSFAIGVHSANNTTAFIQGNGFGTLMSALLTSPYGWIFLIIFFSVVIYVLKNLDKVIQETRKELRNV
jgi:hypothetical protein